MLAEYPFLGRFIDVTTAEELYECYDPQHPLTRGEKRQCGVDLLGYVRSLGLVVGGEHGLWWAVPQLDYIEGMMSANPYFSWPAGWLKHPKSKDEQFTNPHGKKYLLPQDGFAVKGPQIEQSRSLLDGREATVIRAGKYSFSQ